MCYLLLNMTLRKLLRILAVTFISLGVVIGLASFKHPIILKWLSGSAHHIGKPIQATVYANGMINNDIKVFQVDKYWRSSDKANNYLLSMPECDSSGMLRFLNINLNEKWIGRPVGTKRDYDFIAGHLFQSETGGRFSPFQDEMKGFNFDPQLSFTDGQIKFNSPPNILKFDSVRIELQ